MEVGRDAIPSQFLSNLPVQDSFVFLSKSQITSSLPDDLHRGSLSGRLKAAQKLFDLLNGTSMVDHPMCNECADDLMARMSRRLNEHRRQNEAYERFMKELTIEEDSEGIDKELKQVHWLTLTLCMV